MLEVQVYVSMSSLLSGASSCSVCCSEPITVRCPVDVVAGHLITKEKRHDQFGQIAGGAGSQKPEKYQRDKIVEGTGYPCPKTNTRLNLRSLSLKTLAHPNTKSDGYDYSEDFDGVQYVGDTSVYVNLKCIVGKGGNQTRSLREVYHFTEGQLKYLAQSGTSNTYFANILDGDEAHVNLEKFTYLRQLPEYRAVQDRVYVGDLRGYFAWFAATIVGSK